MNTKIFFILISSALFFNSFAFEAEQERLGERLLGAVKNEDLKAVQECLSQGADINYQGFNDICEKDDFTPMCYAILHSNLDITKFLLFNGASIEAGMYPLKWIEEGILNHRNPKSSNHLISHSTEFLTTIRDLLRNHQARFKNLKNKNLSDIVKKVNKILPKIIKDKICSATTLPTVIEGLVLGYLNFYPEDFEGFSQLSEEEVNEIVKIYSEEFEKKEDESEDFIV